MNYEIYLSSEIDGLISKNGQNSIQLDVGMNYKIIAKSGDIFCFYPIDDGQNKMIRHIPYSIKLSEENGKLKINNQCVKLIAISDNTYDLMFLENSITVGLNKTITKTIKLGEDLIEISYINSNMNIVRFNYNLYCSEYILSHNLDDFNSSIFNFENKNYIFLQSKTKNFYYFCVFFIEKYKIYKIGEFLANKIELSKNEFNVITHINDMAKHIQITHYELSNGKIIKKERYLSKLVSTNFITTNIDLIPYAFLESIKVQNYELARNYLSNDLNDKLSNEHLKKYFGNFCDIEQSHKNPDDVNLIYKNNNEYIGKIAKFNIINNKIDNIDIQ